MVVWNGGEGLAGVVYEPVVGGRDGVSCGFAALAGSFGPG